MSTDDDNWFSAAALALLGERFVAGLPQSMSGCMRRAKKESWKSRVVKGGGGKDGVRTEYQPPTTVLALIHAFLSVNPDFFNKSKSRTKAELPNTLNQVPGDSPSQNNIQGAEAFKRLSDVTQAVIRVSNAVDFEPPMIWTCLIQELMFAYGLNEAGARRIVETLKEQSASHE